MELTIILNEETLKADMVIRDGERSISWNSMSFSQKIDMISNLEELHKTFVEILKNELKQ